MVEINFIDSLKSALDELGSVSEQIDSLTLKKEDLRTKISKWLKLNELTEFETYNSDKSKLWRLTISKRTTQSVDKDRLRVLLNETDYNLVVTTKESEALTVKTVKHKKSTESAPIAPKGV